MAKLARERQLGALKQNGAVPAKLPERGDTRDELADMAGVSGRTLAKVERIEAEAIPEVFLTGISDRVPETPSVIKWRLFNGL